MPEISIIVPVYKVEKYLDRCVKSILAQTFTDFELILVDDGSPDNCPQMCDEWAKKDERIRVIHKENGGASNYSIWNRLYKKEILKDIRFLEGKITEDVMFIYEVTKEAKSMVVSNLKKYLYFENRFGVTKSKLNRKDLALFSGYEKDVERIVLMEWKRELEENYRELMNTKFFDWKRKAILYFICKF